MGYYQSGDLNHYMAGDPGFFDWLGGAAKAVGGAVIGAVRTVAPIAAPLIGTALGGPFGGMIGAGLGSLISGGGGGTPDPTPSFHSAALGSGFSQIMQAAAGGFGPPTGRAVMPPYAQLTSFTEPPRQTAGSHGAAVYMSPGEEEFFEEEEEEEEF